MVISRSELGTLLGFKDALSLGFRADMMTSDGVRRAFVGFPGDGINVEVTDHAAEPSETLMSMTGAYDEETDSFDLQGEDVSGETSDGNDVRCVAATFRRYALGMVEVA